MMDDEQYEDVQFALRWLAERAEAEAREQGEPVSPPTREPVSGCWSLRKILGGGKKKDTNK